MLKKRLEAARNGEKTYTGTPCKSCGGKERYVSNGSCISCRKTEKEKVKQAIYRQKRKAMLNQAIAEGKQ